MKRYSCLSLILLMLFVFAASAQVMTAHYGEHNLKFDLESLDSLTFCEESFVQPDDISLSINREGIDAGGAIWMIEVSAMIVDEHTNPVLDGMPVSFSIVEEIAMIDNAVTGNESFEGVSAPGVAHTLLHYHSIQTNSQVTINCSVLGSEGEVISTSMVLNLPAQNLSVDLTSSSANWFFGEDPAVFQADAYVYDGHMNPVNNELVRFLSISGGFYSIATLGSPENPEMYTGDASEYPDMPIGWARRYLIIRFEEAFPDPFMLQRIVEMKAILPNQGVESDVIQLSLSHEAD